MSSNGDGKTACQEFDCVEKGAEKIAPNLLWALWALTMVIFPLSGMLTWAVICGIVFIMLVIFAPFIMIFRRDWKTFCEEVFAVLSRSCASMKGMLFYSIIPYLVIPFLFGGLGCVMLAPLPCLLLSLFIFFFSKDSNEVGDSPENKVSAVPVHESLANKIETRVVELKEERNPDGYE